MTGSEKDRIIRTVHYVIENNNEIRKRVANVPNPLGDGRAGERITNIFIKIAEGDWRDYVPDLRDVGEPTYRLFLALSLMVLLLASFMRSLEVYLLL